VHISRDDAETFEETVEIDCSPYGTGATRVGVIEDGGSEIRISKPETQAGPG
jgi:hypothetical protein